jgi:hypothetical protein
MWVTLFRCVQLREVAIETRLVFFAVASLLSLLYINQSRLQKLAVFTKTPRKQQFHLFSPGLSVSIHELVLGYRMSPAGCCSNGVASYRGH